MRDLQFNMKKKEEFRKDLTALINKYSIEKHSDTPDFMLADYLVSCLETYENTVNYRDIENSLRNS